MRWLQDFFKAVVKVLERSVVGRRLLRICVGRKFYACVVNGCGIGGSLCGHGVVGLRQRRGGGGGRFLLLSLACESGKSSWVVAA